MPIAELFKAMGTGDLFNDTSSFEEPIFYKDLSKKEGQSKKEKEVENKQSNGNSIS